MRRSILAMAALVRIAMRPEGIEDPLYLSPMTVDHRDGISAVGMRVRLCVWLTALLLVAPTGARGQTGDGQRQNGNGPRRVLTNDTVPVAFQQLTQMPEGFCLCLCW